MIILMLIILPSFFDLNNNIFSTSNSLIEVSVDPVAMNFPFFLKKLVFITKREKKKGQKKERKKNDERNKKKRWEKEKPKHY